MAGLEGLSPLRREAVARELAAAQPTQDFADLAKRLVALDAAIGLGADAQVIIEAALATDRREELCRRILAKA